MSILSIFVDETGTVHNSKNHIFGMGGLSTHTPYALGKAILRIRQKYLFYDEIKFNKSSQLKAHFVDDLLDLILDRELIFTNLVIDKREIQLGDPWELYINLLVEILAIINEARMAVIVLDFISLPKRMDLSKEIPHHFENSSLSLFQVGSGGSDLIQVSDLLLGICAYKVKMDLGLVKGDPYKEYLVSKYYQLIKKKGRSS